MAVNGAASSQLLATLGNRPSPSARSEQINFKAIGLPEYKDYFAVLIHDLLSPAECKSLLSEAESFTSGKWDVAMVNIGGGHQREILDIRSCDRILWDELNLADVLLKRIRPFLPTSITTLEKSPLITGRGPAKRQEKWRITRLNERLRFLRYTAGMYFREHQDGSYITPEGDEISFLTVHLYLNSVGDKDENGEELKGGATRFFGERNVFDVNPETGACLVFQHRGLTHSGEDVVSGTKHTIRTDVMYKRVDL